MNTIITAATLFTMFFNSAKTTIAGSDYYYNADIHDNQVCMLDVYQQDDFKMLSRKMEYRFTYDDQNRLVSKEAYKWNPLMMEWSHYYRMNFSYTDDGYAIEVSDWNYMTKTYDAVKEKSVYHIEGDDIASISNYKWNSRHNDFVFTGTIKNQDSALLAKILQMQG
jgi:hypothetical protein